MLPVQEQRAVAATLQGLDRRTLENLAALVQVAPTLRTLAASLAALELAMLQCWKDLTEENAGRYASAALSVARILRKQPRRPSSTTVEPLPHEQIGPWVLDRFLGRGGTGAAYLAHHAASGQVATVKIGSYVEALTAAWLGDDLPAAFLRVLDSGILEYVDSHTHWIAREYAVGPTWGQRTSRPSCDEALDLFRTACLAVDALHRRHVFGWSSHGQNVLWDGERWRLTDLHRSVIVTGLDDLAYHRFLAWITGRPMAEQMYARELFGSPSDLRHPAGITASVGDLARRLREDDCAALGGFLLDALGVPRWGVFFQALNRFPYCSGHYRLTGDPGIDRRLSDLMNRSWRGDAGGALLVANAGRGEQTTYDSPSDLLDDVYSAFRA